MQFGVIAWIYAKTLAQIFFLIFFFYIAGLNIDIIKRQIIFLVLL